MKLRDMKQYVKNVERLLEENQLQFVFSPRSTLSTTLWDALWEQHHVHQYLGFIYDYVEREIEYKTEAAKKDGDYREQFEEFLKRRAKDDEVEEDETNDATNSMLRADWARDDVYSDLQSFFKEKVKCRSGHSPSIFFDWIDDVDDNLEIARIFEVVELTKHKQEKYNRLYNQQKGTEAEIFMRYWLARGVMDKLLVVRKDRDHDSVNVGDMLVCPHCYVAGAYDEFNPEPSERAAYATQGMCFNCGVFSNVRVMYAFAAYLRGEIRVSYQDRIVTEVQALPNEKIRPSPVILGRLDPMSRNKLFEVVQQIVELDPFEVTSVLTTTRDTGCVEVTHRRNQEMADDCELLVCFHVTGEITMGTSLSFDGVRTEANNLEIAYMQTVVAALIDQWQEDLHEQAKEESQIRRTLAESRIPVVR